MNRTKSVLNRLETANPIPSNSRMAPARSDAALADVVRAIQERDVAIVDAPAGRAIGGGRLRAAVVGIVVALLGAGLSLTLLLGGLINRDATAATALQGLNTAGVTYFPDEQVFVVADGSNPVGLAAIIPGESKVPERVLYCPTSGWFEGPHGEMFDRLGNYTLGPAESGLMRVAVEVSGDRVIVDPTRSLGAPPRFVDNPAISEPPPPLGPFCADPHVEAEPGFAAPSGETSALLGVWLDGEGNPVPGVWNEVDKTVISARDYLGTCNWPTAIFLEVGWPLGTTATTSETTRLYVRDPEGIFAGAESEDFDPRAQLQADATNTGYHRGTWELWTSASLEDRAVFLVNGTTVEKWPLLSGDIKC